MNSIYTNWAYQFNRFTTKKVKQEQKYPCTNVSIPELNVVIKLREGHTLEDWIINHCISNPSVKRKLYAAYNIVE